MLGTSINITARKQIEKDLLAAKAEAEKANTAKSAFLANMSHEIRTPLSAIIGYTELLKEQNLDTKERNQFVETISRNGKSLSRIIDDILDLAKVESGKIEFEAIEFSFVQLIDDVLSVFSERVGSKSIYLHTIFAAGVPDRIYSDPTRIRQILINLIGNAVKFTEKGGITISVDCETNGLNVNFTIKIKDTGIGIPEAMRSRLFQPFMQADNTTTRRYGGTGLGLVLSQRLANALGGEISTEDCDNGNGCTFIVTFRAQVAATQLPPTMTTPTEEMAAKNARKFSHRFENLKILIADDSADNQFLAKRFLSNHGAKIDSVYNGVDAVKKGISGHYDIILMDIQMPELDGYEATRALRGAGVGIPIIAFTAHAMAEELARSIAAGCNGHLAKPLIQQDLLKTIDRFMKKDSDENIRRDQ